MSRAPAATVGTVAVILVSLLETTVAVVVSNFTVIAPPSPVPEMYTVLPGRPMVETTSPMRGMVVPNDGLYDQTHTSPPDSVKALILFWPETLATAFELQNNSPFNTSL